ncbi:slipin family protein [Pinibacter aurantiacus]|uniref:Slipin family protein n=1 Tax=Pinibacter aurantiacus TaxID=2851599 RepID=A0A9E2S683_9BACT|nr:slipin family protein [Pinibacter aurantiacus]MBV4356811.1 slipin family protein [Pinibacter aurantiacus]
MKRVKVNAYQVGLVFKDGVYQRMLKEGSYWFWNGQTIQLYDLAKPFNAPIELNILLKDAALAEALEVVEVKDKEIVLQYENGLLKQVLTSGRYAFWKGVMEYNFVRADISKVDITEPIELDVLLSKHVAPFVRSASVEQYEKAVLFVNGSFSKILQGGAYYWWKNATAVSVSRVDVRQQQLEINGQEILTKDKAALRINAWAQYKVTDIEKALLQNKEYDKQLYVAFQLALREYVAGFAFDDLLDKKENIADYVMQRVEKDAQALGVAVIGFGIRDIILPGDVKEIMSQVLIAEKKAQANTIMRREETASVRSMLNTAKLMEENTMLWKLKEMEYVEKIADKISNISVSGNGVLTEQLKEIFVPKK